MLPDPVETPPPVSRAEARRKLGLPDDGELLGLVGVIDKRKGGDLLLAGFRQAALPASTRLLLLLAGEHIPLVRDLLRTEYADLVESGRIISIDRYLSVGELHDALAALDLVCTPYQRQFAIASIVVRAAAADRPVLATDFGWCGRMVPAFKLGWTCHVEDAVAFGRAMSESLDRARDWQISEGGKRLRQFHAPENFIAAFTARLRERLGLPPLPETMTWEYVEQAATQVSTT